MKANPHDLHALMSTGFFWKFILTLGNRNAHDKEIKQYKNTLLFYLEGSRIMTQHETFMIWF